MGLRNNKKGCGQMLTIGVRDFGKIMAENESGSSLVAFAKLAKALGYRDTSKRMPMTTHAGEVVQLGDIIELLKDNPFIFQNLVNSEEIEVQYFSEDEDLPENVVVEIKSWMRKNVSDYRDDCGELDYTGLAEGCANELGIFINADCDIPDEVFDLAAEIDEDDDEDED